MVRGLIAASMMFVFGVMALGCGGSVKVNAPKTAALKKVAIVGICSVDTMGAKGGGAMGQVETPTSVLTGIAAGFDRGLPTAYTNVSVMPQATVLQNSSMPTGELPPHAVCAGGVSPFIPKGRNPKPDKVLMGKMAEALGVDAVVAVYAAPGATVSDSDTKIFEGAFNPTQVYMVDRSGEAIVEMKIKGIEGIAESDEKAAAAFGEALAVRLAEALQES